MTEKQMTAELLKRLSEMKSLHRRNPSTWGKFIADGLTICEKLSRRGELRAARNSFLAPRRFESVQKMFCKAVLQKMARRLL